MTTTTKFSNEELEQSKEFLQNCKDWDSNEVEGASGNLIELDDITNDFYEKIDAMDLFPYWGHGYTYEDLLETYKNSTYETNN